MASPLCVLNSCCYCIDLRTGCFIVGYLQLIGCLLQLVSSLWSLVSDDPEVQSLVKQSGLSLAAIVAIVILFYALFLSFVITLLVGLHQNKRCHVLVYLIFWMIITAIATIPFAIALFIKGAFFYVLLAYIIIFGPNIYILLVIRSYYFKMGERNINSTECVYDGTGSPQEVKTILREV